MTNDTEAKLKRAAGLYAEQEGEKLLAEAEEIRSQNLTYLLPRADKTVQDLLKRNKPRREERTQRSSRKAVFGVITAAACFILIVRIAGPFSGAFSENGFSGSSGGGMSSGAAAPAAPSAPAPAGGAAPGVAADEANLSQLENERGDEFDMDSVNKRYSSVLQKETTLVSEQPEAAFPLIAGTSSYINVKNSIEEGYLPPAETVRTEELINWFSYDEPLVQKQSSPFSFYTEIGLSPFDKNKRLGLIRVGTKQTGANDVKALVKFNPETVRSYRFIGYENSMPNSDIKDGEEIGPGLDVIVLLEFEPKEFDKAASSIGHFFTVRIDYKNPGESKENLIEVPVGGAFPVTNSPDFGFASAVALFGDYLRDPDSGGRDSVNSIIVLAENNLGSDRNGDRKDFVRLLNELAEL